MANAKHKNLCLSPAARAALKHLIEAVSEGGIVPLRNLNHMVEVEDTSTILRAIGAAGPELARHSLAGRRVQDGQGYVYVTRRGVKSHLKARAAGLI